MKIYLVIQESNVAGQFLCNVMPCTSMKRARQELRKEKGTLLGECSHYTKYDKSQFKVEESEMGFFIQDLYDDYYEDIRIEEREVLS